MDINKKRFIEVSFPVKEVGEISAKEKNIRHGHISTLHIWWSRKPLAVSRAINYASLINISKDIIEWQKEKNFIIELSKWENSNNQHLIEEARKKILESNNGIPPKIIDPFGGGGSIPLEALRLGCEVYSNDYNPIAVLIQKATLEYPLKYSKIFPGMPDFNKLEFDKESDDDILFDINSKITNPLLFSVLYWGYWVLEKAENELKDFYNINNEEIPVGYYWMRTIPCQNPMCGVHIPLTANWWLAKKDNKKISLYPNSKGPGKQIEFDIIAKNIEGYKPWVDGFDPEEGTVARANVRCPACGFMIDDKTTRKLFQTGNSSERMIAVVYTRPDKEGKFYRLATEEDFAIFEKAKQFLDKKIEELRKKWMIEPVPDEELLFKSADQLPKYGMPKYGDLFNPRQKVSLLVFADAVRRAYEKMRELGYLEDFAKAVTVYLGTNISRMADKGATLCIWSVTDEYIAHVFGRQALPMTWDYFEFNPFSGVTGDWLTSLNYITKPLEELSQILNSQSPTPNPQFTIPTITLSSATQLNYPDNYFDAVLTDPPYYDNVSYATLSDFFYVWLKRTVGHLFPELFATPLTPKSGEIIANVPLHKDKEKAKKFFEEQLALSFKEMYRILKPGGIAVIVYAHKSTAGWETVINALLDSGLVVNSSWPVNTEMQSRLNAKETASLASSIYIVARKMERKDIGFYPEVKKELESYMNEKLDRLWDEGIGGADFFISAIGAGIEIFGKYKKIIDYSGNEIRADIMLEDIRKLATDYAVHKILHNGFAGEINELTRYYVLFRWEYGLAKVNFDEARKLATSVGIDLSEYWNKNSFIRKDKELIYLIGPEDRKIEEIENSNELIDVLHHVLILWEKNKKDELYERLERSGYGKSEAFYRVAQAISETLPIECKEKKLLDGFLTGKERTINEIKSKFDKKNNDYIGDLL